jgi:hypothetical protein
MRRAVALQTKTVQRDVQALRMALAALAREIAADVERGARHENPAHLTSEAATHIESKCDSLAAAG